MAELTSRRTFLERMTGAARLDGRVYEEVMHDGGAIAQAVVVVVFGAIAAGIGGLTGGAPGLVVGVVTALIGWLAYVFAAHWVGTNWFRPATTSGTWGNLLRTLGFANTPRILLVIGIVPIFGLVLAFIVLLWTLFATIVAVRHSLGLGTGSAVVTALVSWLVLVVVSFVVTAVVTILV